MGPRKFIAILAAAAFLFSTLTFPASVVYAHDQVPTSEELDQLLAPVALYPDALLAQICAATTDPQQILDVDNWVKQNANLTGQARSDAAQQAGFDPAFIALVNFPQVLDMMTQNIDDYAAIGQAFSANQASVMDAVQRLRQQAYASGALETNQYQNVQVQGSGTTQVVVIQPANPQIVYVPQYNPQVVYVQPDPSAVVAASIISFGAGVALGAWINNSTYPWYWGGWGWNWGRRNVIVYNNVWVVNNRYRPPRRYYNYRPPFYGRPIYVRPPPNWHDRPYYRPPSGRPPGNRPPPKPGPPPPSKPGTRPPPNPGTPPPSKPGTRPPSKPGTPPPSQPGTRPPSQPGTRPPSGGGPGTTQPVNPGKPAPGTKPAPGATRPAQPYKPNPAAGYPRPPQGGQGGGQTGGKPGGQTGGWQNSGGRTSAFGGGHNNQADRAAVDRGRQSMNSQQNQKGGGNRR